MPTLLLGTKMLADGEYVYFDDEETLRVINDGGVLKMQKYENDAWNTYESWGE